MANQLHATLLAATYVSPPSGLRPNSQVSDQRPLQIIRMASPECTEVHPELKIVDQWLYQSSPSDGEKASDFNQPCFASKGN